MEAENSGGGGRKGGEKQPCLDCWRCHSWEGYKPATKHTATWRSTPVPALTHRREERAREDAENKRLLQNHVCRSHWPSTALCWKCKDGFKQKNDLYLPNRCAQKEDWVLTIQIARSQKETKHNAADSLHFLYHSVGAARQCFPIQTTAIHHKETGVAGNGPIISATERKQQGEQLNVTDRFYETRRGPCSELSNSSFPYQKKSNQLQLHALTNQESELLHCDFSRERNRDKWKYFIAAGLCQIPGLCKSGNFCSFHGSMLAQVWVQGWASNRWREGNLQPAVLQGRGGGEREPMVLSGNHRNIQLPLHQIELDSGSSSSWGLNTSAMKQHQLMPKWNTET